MPSVQFLALWSVLGEMQTAPLERFSQWLATGQNKVTDSQEQLLRNVMAATLKLREQERSSLLEFVLGALEARHAGR